MQKLKDPLNDRVVKNHSPPPLMSLTKDLLYTNIAKCKTNIDIIRDHFIIEGTISKEDFKRIASTALEIIKKEPNLLIIDAPATIIGDIHGQYYDMIRMMELINKDQEQETLLFLGDYVDRGIFCIEVIFYLFCLKVNKPDKMFMLRGNHECRELTAYFNFRQECIDKYDQEIYDIVMNLFDCLPLAARVNNKFLCVHGGIGPQFSLGKEMDNLNRFIEPPQTGMFCDALWADPVSDKSGLINGGGTYMVNAIRRCSYYYGYEACKSFLLRNNLVTIIRAHEAQINGYDTCHWGNEGFPQVITIFSAPNYCGSYNNKAAFIQVRGNELTIRQFYEVDSPYFLPQKMDVFNWSIPFVGEKLIEIFMGIVKYTEPSDGNFDLSLEEEDELEIIMQNPDIQRCLNKQTVDSNFQDSEIETLEKIMNKKHVLAQDNFDLINSIDLNGSLIRRDSLQSEEEADPKIFNLIKESDLVNEKRPSLMEQETNFNPNQFMKKQSSQGVNHY